MNKLTGNLLFVAAVTNFFTSSCKHGGTEELKPNIIIIYTDDLGIGDVSYTNGKVIPTPNIDQLARNGKIFTQYYTNAPVCSPSQVAVTTGMYPIRWNINTFLNNRKFNSDCEQSDYLNESATTIADFFKNAGYKTAHFGKWHMGGGRDVKNAPSIAEYGFDEFSSTWESPDPDPVITSANWIWDENDRIKRWNRTAYFVDKTLDFLTRNPYQPCFVNLWPDDIHSPWVPDEAIQEDKTEWYKISSLKPVLSEFDRQIGRLMDGLRQLGLEENTLVIFTSDNGPQPGFNRLRTNNLRGTKNSLYEGGINMPFVMHWPERIAAGQIDSLSVISAVDLLPTLCSISGIGISLEVKIDGEDFSKAVLTKKHFDRECDLYWEYGRNSYYNYPDSANHSLQLSVRHGQWKLFTNPEGTQTELYDLSTDLIESKDLSGVQPELSASLKNKLINWYIKNDKEFIVDKKNSAD